MGLVTSDLHDACVTHDSHDQWSYKTRHAEENRVGFIVLPLDSTDVLVRQINIPNGKRKNDYNSCYSVFLVLEREKMLICIRAKWPIRPELIPVSVA